MLVVMALGRSAFLDPEEAPDVEAQRAHVRAAVSAIAQVAREHRVVVTHGSAPQVGQLAYQSALSHRLSEHPLDVAEAEAEGLIGYLLQQELGNELSDHDVATLLTQVVVDPTDPGFSSQLKLVGPELAQVDAERMTRDRGWTMVADGARWWRAVPSPEPLAIIERRSIQLLVDAGVLVVCAGGGGIPVAMDAEGTLRGVDAVVDKDRAAALLAAVLNADLLLLLTDVPAVAAEWGSAFVRPISRATPTELRSLDFDPATMGPKVTAACRFVERTGRRAAIGAVTDAARLVAGQAGTQVVSTPGALPVHVLAS
jgi:carbamate kinase